MVGKKARAVRHVDSQHAHGGGSWSAEGRDPGACVDRGPSKRTQDGSATRTR